MIVLQQPPIHNHILSQNNIEPQIKRMPSSIRPGAKVQARVGPFQIQTTGDNNSLSQEPKKKTRRVRSLLDGWVVGPGLATSQNNSWRVLWTVCAKTCDHSVKSLKLVSDASQRFDESIFGRLLPADYLPSTKELQKLIDNGRYNSTLNLSEPVANLNTASINSGKLYYFILILNEQVHEFN